MGKIMQNSKLRSSSLLASNPTMSSLCLLALLLTCFGLQVKKSTAEKVSSLKTEIIEFIQEYDGYSNRTSETLVYPKSSPNSQLVIGEDTSIGSRLLLKCTADFPVQWIYLGDGKPEFTTFTNVEWMGTTGPPLKFSAEASLGLLGFQRTLHETDTGNYTCRSIQDPKVLSFYYIYVPGPALFTKQEGGNITYSYKDTTVRIPCSISDPSTAKSLQCPVKDATRTYDPKKGYQLNLWEQPNPSGTYVCAGTNRNTNRVVKYNLIPTTQTSPRDPCNPNPCGYQADCSADSDGTAICYCFRGYNGNPYDQCKNGPVEGTKCYSETDCPLSKSCLLGKCVDPCDPSPCGSGGSCEVYGRKARCSCQRGFEGKPPYCKKSCVDNFDCGRNEICSRKFCVDACPGPCGTNADCRVAQRGAHRNTICSCPSGTTGDPTKRCRAVGNSNIPPWKSCPSGYIGKPPNCEPVECDIDEDCPPGKDCVNNICQRQSPPKGSLTSCGGQCGLNAECKTSLFSKESKCECLKGYTGDPDIFCSIDDDFFGLDNNQPSRTNPCKPNPCPNFGDCKVVSGKVKCKLEASPAKCPKGFIGKPPKCIPDDDLGLDSNLVCEFDFDCQLNEECVNERCVKDNKGGIGDRDNSSIDDECEGTCGINAECKRTTDPSAEYDFDCFCKKGYKGNPFITCKPIADSSPTGTSSLCDPSPCSNLASCRVINGQGVCKCPRGYRGNPYVDCNSRGSSQFPQPTTEAPYRNPYPTTRRSSSRRDECELEDDSIPYSYRSSSSSYNSCGQNGKCDIINGYRVCVCKSGYSGTPPDCRKYQQNIFRCIDDEDCAVDETCKNRVCVDPCSRDSPKYPCAPNAECRVVDGNPLCSCSRGFIGDPHHHCRPKLSGRGREPSYESSATSNRNLNVRCDISRLVCRGANSEASCVEGEPLCVCQKGYVGYPPNCRLECEKNSHCYKSKVCTRNQCVDPCEKDHPCSTHERCTVLNHILMCLPNTGNSNTNPCSNGYRSSRCRYE